MLLPVPSNMQRRIRPVVMLPARGAHGLGELVAVVLYNCKFNQHRDRHHPLLASSSQLKSTTRRLQHTINNNNNNINNYNNKNKNKNNNKNKNKNKNKNNKNKNNKNKNNKNKNNNNLSSPAVLAFAWWAVRYTDWYMQVIDQNRRDVLTLIVALEDQEDQEGVVNTVHYVLAWVWLRSVLGWLEVAYAYYELWFIRAHVYVMMFDPTAVEDPDEGDDENMGGGGDDDDKGGRGGDGGVNCGLKGYFQDRVSDSQSDIDIARPGGLKATPCTPSWPC